jgi:GGDEF domain-containing protein
VILDGQEVRVGVSIGVAMSTDGASAPEDLLRHADAAMYQAKLQRKATRAA